MSHVFVSRQSIAVSIGDWSFVGHLAWDVGGLMRPF